MLIPFLLKHSLIDEMQEITVGPGMVFHEEVLGQRLSKRWNMMLDSMDPDNNQDFMPVFRKNHGILMYLSDPIRDFGTDYAYQAMVARMGFRTNPTYVAIYPSTNWDS